MTMMPSSIIDLGRKAIVGHHVLHVRQPVGRRERAVRCRREPTSTQRDTLHTRRCEIGFGLFRRRYRLHRPSAQTARRQIHDRHRKPAPLGSFRPPVLRLAASGAPVHQLRSSGVRRTQYRITRSPRHRVSRPLVQLCTERAKAEALDKASEAIGVLRELGLDNDTILKELVARVTRTEGTVSSA
jgi:hypothetical protein